MRVKGTPNVSNFHYKVTYKDEVKYFKTQPDIIRCYNISRHAKKHTSLIKGFKNRIPI